MAQKLKLTFCGGAGVVTGANFLLENETVKILVDCGFEQGGKTSHDFNASKFPYDPKSINYLFITHSHVDHVGRIPKLVKGGFQGKIYSTPETRELAQLMLEDSAGLLTREAKRLGIEPLYTDDDIRAAMALWDGIPYHTAKAIDGGFSVYLKDAGHVLGSSMIEFTYNGKKIVFTGDLGNSPTPLLKDTEIISDADYMVMESVYGDRNHEPKSVRDARFRDVVKETIAKKGTLIIPAFSLDRSQVILYELNAMEKNEGVPAVPVFLDSPLGIKVTKIYQRDGKDDFNAVVQKEIADGDNIFNFPRLRFTTTTDESKAILNASSPKIVIAGSGMSNGGRILHHEKNYLPDPNATLLLIGYEAAGTLGRQLQEGAKTVTIYGEEIAVNAKIVEISGYSSHKDSEHLVEFVSHTAKTVKKVFCAMGEPKSSLFLVQRLRDYLNVDAVAPLTGQSYELEF